MAVLEVKATVYLLKRRVSLSAANRADLVVSKLGRVPKENEDRQRTEGERESYQHVDSAESEQLPSLIPG